MAHECIPKLDYMFSSAYHGEPVSLRSFKNVLENSDGCPICEIMIHLVQQHVDTIQTKSSSGKDIPCVGINSERNNEKVPEDIDVMFEHDPDANSVYRFIFRKSTRLLAGDPSRNDQLRFNGRVNFDFLSEWIDVFQSMHHGESCAVQQRLPHAAIPGFRLIDVNSLQIIEDIQSPVYVALSYVWGSGKEWLQAKKDNIAGLQFANGLGKRMGDLPRTIRNAIDLVRGVGLSYIWIDALCIVQDDLSQKMDQISNMGAIYEQAKFTIVAAYGQDSDAGLPGMEAGAFPLRASMKTVKIDNTTFLTSLPEDLGESMRFAKWNTRGWTFQESLLSRTQMVFTQTQIHLRCSCGKSCRERSALDAFQLSSNPAERLKLLESVLSEEMETESGDLWLEYYDLAAQYSQRDLTNPSDILNAFSAIMAKLERKWTTPFHFGMPEKVFTAALLWFSFSASQKRTCTVPIRHKGQVVQRPIPTWSWAAWYGQFTPGPKFWHPEDPEEIQPDEPTSTWKFSPHLLRTMDKEGTLHLITIESTVQVAYFDIDSPQTQSIQSEDLDMVKRPMMHRESGATIGFITVRNSHLGTKGRVCGEFLGIATRGDAFWTRQKGQPRMVHAMLIQRLENGFAQRVAITKVLLDHWWAAEPVEQFIQLC